MATKADIIKDKITSYRAKLAADNGKADLLDVLANAEKRLNAKSILGESVDDATAVSIATDAITKINAYNSQVQLAQLDVDALSAALAAADPDPA